MLITATSALGGIGASPWDRLSRLVFLQLFQSVEEFLARQDRNRNLPLNELKSARTTRRHWHCFEQCGNDAAKKHAGNTHTPCLYGLDFVINNMKSFMICRILHKWINPGSAVEVYSSSNSSPRCSSPC
ncbi:hypothetical protein Q8A67_021347 [Cirrhinus molitorella]|uniref:Uncharacterized protein n=1 Tax=Cirrhinus molitorella TaxID=172907 RepID=A0AA88TBV7_9TELE|nr:hypothetical protein Q8A67_021347 [Cirrhinus molitorella]